MNEAMKGAESGKPRKRYCPQGHDTWDVGRIGNGSSRCRKCQYEGNKLKAARDLAQRAKARTETEPVPGLWALRRRKGYTVEQLAWECHNLSKLQISMIEAQTRHATYHERVEIFQAFNVLDAKRLEEKEAEMEQVERLKRAGVA